MKKGGPVPKDFEQLNYYDMLDIKPDASPFEVRHAYNAAMQVYHPQSLVSYSFFTGEERRKILSLIEKAYQTLISEQARKAYDAELIGRGELAPSADAASPARKPVGIFDISRGHAVRPALSAHEELKSRIAASALVGEILSKNELRGADLKQIREELGVAIERVAQETKIRLDHLRNMEDDQATRLPAPVFLKGFVKSYLKCLCLEPQEDLSGRYMDTVARLLKK